MKPQDKNFSIEKKKYQSLPCQSQKNTHSRENHIYSSDSSLQLFPAILPFKLIKHPPIQDTQSTRTDRERINL